MQEDRRLGSLGQAKHGRDSQSHTATAYCISPRYNPTYCILLWGWPLQSIKQDAGQCAFTITAVQQEYSISRPRFVSGWETERSSLQWMGFQPRHNQSNSFKTNHVPTLGHNLPTFRNHIHFPCRCNAYKTGPRFSLIPATGCNVYSVYI